MLALDGSYTNYLSVSPVTFTVSSYGSIADTLPFSGTTAPYRVSVTGTNIPVTLSGYTSDEATSITIDASGTSGAHPTTYHQDHTHVWNSASPNMTIFQWACGSGDELGAIIGQAPQNYQIVYTGPQIAFAENICAVAPTTKLPLDHFVIDPKHHHAFTGPTTINTLTLQELYPGHTHTFTGYLDAYAAVAVYTTIDPNPHDHQIAAKTIANSLWIIDVTHGDTIGKHYHGVTIDDHQLKKAKHIPPYMALLQIVRTY
jgi:hypothetical protein